MLSTQNLQITLSSNGGKILDNISLDQVEKYHYIKENLYRIDVRKDQEFQDQYIQLNEFKKKRIKPKFRERFFELLERQKVNRELNIRKLSQELFGVRPNRYKPKHFSMVTQLMHTIHEDYPVYDKNVAELFDYHPLKGDKVPIFRKLNHYTDFYNYVIGAYREFLVSGELYSLLRALELKFRKYKEFLTHSKSLDLLLRSAGSLKRQDSLIASKRFYITTN